MKKLLFTYLLVFFTVLAGTAQNNVADLIGSRASSVDGFMQNKGYVHIHSSKSYGGIYSYWWKSTKSKCVSIRIEDGQVTDAKTTTPGDCRQGNNDYSYQSHQSHHHDSYSHYDSNERENSYERGYNDGLYNKSYHNTAYDSDLKAAYSQGYTAGVSQRRSNTDYHYGNGGYMNDSSESKLSDLKGWTASRAYREIENRGYRFVKEYRNNGKLVKVWYNSEYRKCKKTADKDGYIDLIDNSKQCGR